LADREEDAALREEELITREDGIETRQEELAIRTADVIEAEEAAYTRKLAVAAQDEKASEQECLIGGREANIDVATELDRSLEIDDFTVTHEHRGSLSTLSPYDSYEKDSADSAYHNN
jgi:hypothetical protein